MTTLSRLESTTDTYPICGFNHYLYLVTINPTIWSWKKKLFILKNNIDVLRVHKCKVWNIYAFKFKKKTLEEHGSKPFYLDNVRAQEDARNLYNNNILYLYVHIIYCTCILILVRHMSYYLYYGKRKFSLVDS